MTSSVSRRGRTRAIAVVVLVLLALGATFYLQRDKLQVLVGTPLTETPERMVTLTFSGTLADCCRELEKQTGYHYELDDSLRQLPVQIAVKDAPVFQVHRLLSRQAGVVLERDANTAVIRVRRASR